MKQRKTRGIRNSLIVFVMGMALSFASICCTPVFADELQVADYLGLVRAQRDINGKVTVAITVIRNEKEELDVGFGNPLLVQRTGVSPNIESVEVSPMTYEFYGVSAGVWRIRLRNKGLLLGKVEIIPHVR